ncbi:hypothetical protein GOM49_04410 [Clostridium bovifaecis]|uniref:Uncharacterized protein n=1 Tax=Clostridium bovifaecis TaxID=2184719 RepID=A0A6I6F9P8_9CLOT|nr:hypothetical protein GOM49_04410 [Clostridium bovifaecis]
MDIKAAIKKIFHVGEDKIEKDNLENVKIYIKQELRKKGFENNQIEIDFSNVCTSEEVIKVAEQLGFNLEKGDKEGVWWLFR